MPQQLLQALGWALLNSLWQLALLWSAYQLAAVFLHTAHARHRANLACGLLVAGFSWFIGTLVVVYAAIRNGESISSPVVSVQIADWLPAGLNLLSAIYLLLLLFPLFRFIRNYRYVQVIRTYGQSKIDADWRIFVQQTATLMGIRKKVQIWVSDLVASPVTIGFLKPLILVPVAAMNHLSPQQLEAVLLHELAHIRRYDYLLNLLITLIKTILYFNPFVYALVKTLEREREKSCDELVLQFRYNAFQYASALLTLQQSTRQPQTLILHAKGKKGDLLARIEHIMGHPPKPAVTPQKIAGLLAVLTGIVFLNLVLLLPGQPTGKRAISAYTTLLSPLDLTYTTGSGVPENPATETAFRTISTPQTQPEKVIAAVSGTVPATSSTTILAEPVLNNSYRQAGYNEMAIPVLKQYQEAQVKEALAASRRVLADAQWKTVERSIADAFTELEKKEIKRVYEQSLDKADWQKLENKLKMAYARIDWEHVNEQINTALDQIRADSLQRVYNDIAIRLNEVQQELNAGKMHYIPDTDINLVTIEEKQQKVQESLRKLNAIRAKKIVRL